MTTDRGRMMGKWPREQEPSRISSIRRHRVTRGNVHKSKSTRYASVDGHIETRRTSIEAGTKKKSDVRIAITLVDKDLNRSLFVQRDSARRDEACSRANQNSVERNAPLTSGHVKLQSICFRREFLVADLINRPTCGCWLLESSLSHRSLCGRFVFATRIFRDEKRIAKRA